MLCAIHTPSIKLIKAELRALGLEWRGAEVTGDERIRCFKQENCHCTAKQYQCDMRKTWEASTDGLITPL